jgi:hypothetical protein
MRRQVAVRMVAGAMLACAGLAFAQGQAPAAAAAPGAEQRTVSSQELELLRKDIRSQKKQLVAQNLQLSDTDATKFWPIYDKYTAELVKINNKKYAAFQDYADHFRTLSDEQAVAIVKQWQDVDIQAAQLRAKYLPVFIQAVGGKTAATFAQIDRRISMMIDLQLGRAVPLVQQTP